MHSVLPESLELAQLLSNPDNYDTILPLLTTSTLNAILPYLHFSTLINLSQTSIYSTTLFGTTKEQVVNKLSQLIDWQRDWCLSDKNGCPEELRDGYLVDLFGGDLREREVLKVVPDGVEYLLKAKELVDEKEMCKDVEEFKKNLDRMSNGIFANLDWNSVVLGGGSVLACLSNEQDSPGFAGSDFDLFLYGLKPDQLVPKIDSIIKQLSSAFPQPVLTQSLDDTDNDSHNNDSSTTLIIKGFNALTILPPLDPTHQTQPRRAIQIVLQSNLTKFDTIAGFDLDGCAMLFDGEKVLAIAGAIRALNSKVNYFDPKFARNFDTTASIVSSRAVKYQSRGYSLALSPAASSYLASKTSLSPIDSLSIRIDAIKRSFDSELLRRAKPTNELFGLKLLLRKEWNRDHRKEGKDGNLQSDYGPMRNALVHGISKKDLKVTENDSIARGFEDWQNSMADKVTDYLCEDERILQGFRVNKRYFEDCSIPYPHSTNSEVLFGFEEDELDPRTNIQYIVAVPKSLLPFIAQAEEDINRILAPYLPVADGMEVENLSDWSNISSPSPIAPPTSDVGTSSVAEALKKAKDLDLVPFPPSIYTPSSDLEPFVPPFKGPHPSGPSPRIQLTYPLENRYGDNVATTSDTSDYVYRIFVVSSLLQFRGLSKLADQVKDLLYLSYTALARVAKNTPKELKLELYTSDGFTFDCSRYEELKDEIISKALNDVNVAEEVKYDLRRYLKQPSKEVVEDRFKRELEWIEEMGKAWMGKGEEKELGKLGEWDSERQGWLNDYIDGKAMI